MKLIFPPHYHRFRCVAARCPDSCCKDWEIVPDDAAVKMYQTLPGIMGERLRGAMTRDADGDVIFQLQNHRCPFWNKAQLCDIQDALGEEALCDTCRDFPRIIQDHGDFMEYDLSLACPEAARLLFSMKPEAWTLTAQNAADIPEDVPVYPYAVMRQRYLQREKFFSVLKDMSVPAVQGLSRCMQLAQEEEAHFDSCTDIEETAEAILRFLRQCEILTRDWQSILDSVAVNKPSFSPIDAATDREIRLFAMDMLYRHYLNTAYAETLADAAFPMQLTAFAVDTVLLLLDCLRWQQDSRRLRIWQLFVKEIEYDSDNLDALGRQFRSESALSWEALRKFLLWR